MGFLDFLASMGNLSGGDEDFYIGDLVYVVSIGCEGEIIGIHGNKYEVEFDNEDGDRDRYSDFFDKSDLRKM